MAKPRGYESVRLEDVTEQMNKLRERHEQRQVTSAGRKLSVPARPARPEPANGATLLKAPAPPK
jgi:hypothetical protein